MNTRETAADIEAFLQFLLPHSVRTCQNALIHTLALWLDEHLRGDSAKQLKSQAVMRYEGIVGKVISEKRYRRRQLPKGCNLPNPHADIKIEQAPEVIIRNAPEYASSISSAKTDDDLIRLLEYGLYIYTSQGYG